MTFFRPILMRAAAALALSATVAIAPFSPAVAQEEIDRGGTLAYNVNSMVPSLDPLFGSSPGSDRRVYNIFYESLVWQGRDGTVHPALATDWEWAEDGLSITLNLREGVVFHDGTPFDAEAAKFNLDRAIDESLESRALQFTQNLELTEVIDPLTIRVNLKEPSASFMSVLALEPASMVSPTALQELGDDFPRNPVGTGPFKLESWTGDVIKAIRFDDYWGVGADGEPLPYLDGIEVRAINNSAIQMTELRAGTLDMGAEIGAKDFATVMADPSLELLPSLRPTLQYLAFNNEGSIFDGNLELRKAISLGLNRENLERAITLGEGEIPTGLMPPSSWAYGPDLPAHTYDPEAARAAYEASGHSGPITLSVIQRDPDTQVAQVIQSMLKDIGIDLRIEVLERAAWLDKVLTYNYELGILRAGLPRADPDLSFSTYYGRDAAQDFAGIKSPELWDIIDAARLELDQDKRRVLYQEAQKYLLENYYQTYLFWTPSRAVANVNVKGFEQEAGGGWMLAGIWLDQ